MQNIKKIGGAVLEKKWILTITTTNGRDFIGPGVYAGPKIKNPAMSLSSPYGPLAS